MQIERFVSKLLGPPQRMASTQPAATYHDRWTIMNGTRLRVYLDHFVSDDWSRDLGDCPKQFLSVGFAEFVEGRPKKFEISRGEVAWMLLITRPSRPD